MPLIIEAETKIDSDPCVAALDNTLFIGTEDGSVMTFDAKLSPGLAWKAHSVQLFALAAGAGRVYTASNDGGLRVWSQDGKKLAELPLAGGDVGVLRIFDNMLFVGDEGGVVSVYENNALIAKYNLLEEVKDLWFSPPYLFTARDLDITVTEIKPKESTARFMTRHTMEGRAPLRVSGPYLITMARGGNDLRLYSATCDNTFKKLQDVKVSDMIVTSLSVTGEYAWTGGWDGHLKWWKISGDQIIANGDINLGSCINALVSSASDKVYAVLAGGRIVCIKAV